MTFEKKTLEEQTAQNKKAAEEELQRQVVESAIANQERARKHAQELRSAAWLDEMNRIRSKGKFRDEHGAEKDLWNKLLDNADRSINSAQSTIHDWRSGMNDLLVLFSSMVDAGGQSMDENLIEFEEKYPLKQTVREGCIQFKDFLVDKMQGEPNVDLPALLHQVKFSDDNKLDCSQLKRSDNVAIDPNSSLAKRFQTLVTLWLYQHGYEPGTEPGTYVSKTPDDPTRPKVLTKDYFEKELLNHKTTGLNAFLNAKYAPASQLEFVPYSSKN